MKSCPKALKVVLLSEVTATTLTFRDPTADITYCADVTLFLHVSRTVTDCGIFFYTDFSLFIALNAIWTHFLGAKLRFSPNIIPP